MNVRTAAVCLVFTLVLGVAGAHAQGPPAGGPGSAAALTARLDALEASVAALTARVTAIETIDESDIVGRYQFAYLGIELNGASNPHLGKVGTSEGHAVVTLGADHSVVFSDGRSLTCTLTIMAFGTTDCDVPEEEEEPGPPTWSVANGLLTLGAGDPNDQLVFRVGANGVFLAADSSEYLPGNGWAVVFVLTKLAN